MKPPDITNLQLLVLSVLATRSSSGRALRAELGKRGFKRGGPAFYQLMGRLEENEWVEGWYEQRVIESQIIKERHYKIRGHGVRALNSVRAFYQSLPQSLPGGMAHA